MLKKPYLIFLLSCLLHLGILGQEIEIIKDPKPNCFEKNYYSLKEVARLKDVIDKNTILGEVSDVTADNQGNIYVFDRRQSCIFKFDQHLKFVKKFGHSGQGPGDFSTPRGLPVLLNVTGENRLYARDCGNKRVTVFSLDGEYISDYKTELSMPFLPVVSEKGERYMPSTRGGVLDVFDGNMKLIDILLDKKEFRRFLFYEPPPGIKQKFSTPKSYNMLFDLTKGGSLLVYISNSSSVYVIDKGKWVKKFDLWPEQVLKEYKPGLNEAIQESMPDDEAYLVIAGSFFLDRDQEEFFYVNFPRADSLGMDTLYKFNTGGRLVKVLYVKRGGDYTNFKCKRNGLFYAVRGGILVLYRE